MLSGYYYTVHYHDRCFYRMVTATESAAIACVWVLIVGKFYYRTLTKEKVWKALVTSMTTAGGILIINAAAKPLSYLVAFSGVPSLCAQFITAHISSRYVVLFLINIILLILGATMECSANILIFAPILVPMAISYGWIRWQWELFSALTVRSVSAHRPLDRPCLSARP